MINRVLRRIVAFAVVLSSVVLASCGLVEVIPDKDNARVVARVGTDTITKGELLYMYEINKSYFEITEDMEADSAYADYIKQCKEDILDYMIQDKVVEIRAREAGYLNYSEQDKLDAQAEVDAGLEDYLDYYRMIYTPEEDDESVDVEALAQQALDDMLASSGESREGMVEQQLLYTGIERYMNDQVADVVSDESEVKSEYESRLASQKEAYAENITDFESDYYAGSIICYRPEGYRFVKHILIKLPEDKEYAFQSTRASATSVENEMASLEDEIVSLKVELDATDDADRVAELDAQIIELAGQAQEKADEYSLLTELADEEREDALKEITASATSVLEKAQSGEDFQTLIDEFGEDSGMQSETYGTVGYLLCRSSSYMPEFIDASLNLTQTDSISGLVPTDYGYHIIKLMEIVTPGDVPYEDVKEALTQEVTTSKQDLRKAELEEEWYSMAVITKYINRI